VVTTVSAPSPPPRRPRRHSRRRYAIRRAVAALILVVAGFGIVQVVRSVVTDGDAVADGVAAPADTTVASGSAPTVDPLADPVDTVVETTDPEPDTTGPATPQDPAKVFIVGDSDAGTFGPYLQTLLDGTGVVTTELDYKVSSGLARPDFFDWPAEIDAKLPEVDPDIVVATFGGNDAQGLAVANGDFIVGDPVANEAEWVAEYSERVGGVMDQLRAGGRTVIWVGIPNDDNPEVTARMAIQDKAARAAAAERPDVIFIDTWKRFSGRTGGWAEFVIDPRDGEGKDVRADDGFHLNQTGAEILAIDIAQAIRDTLRADGAQI
jgi:uncharacterized protein